MASPVVNYEYKEEEGEWTKATLFSQEEHDKQTLSPVTYGEKGIKSIPWHYVVNIYTKRTRTSRAPERKDPIDITPTTITNNTATGVQEASRLNLDYDLLSLLSSTSVYFSIYLKKETRCLFHSKIPLELPKSFTENEYAVLSETIHRRRSAVIEHM